MIIRMGRPFANDHSDGPGCCKWSSVFLPFNQILLNFYFYFQPISFFPPTNIIFSFNKFLLLLQILGSRFNFADLSKNNVFLLILTFWSLFQFLFALLALFLAHLKTISACHWPNMGVRSFFLSQMGSSASLTLLNSLRCTSVVAEVFRVASYLYFWSTRALAKNCEF